MSQELKHYGVKGMRWGVRRASKRLSTATTKEDRAKAVSSLNKHRTKATNKITKLDNKYSKLQTTRNKQIEKSDIKEAKLRNKVSKLRSKKYGMFTSQSKADKLEFKATKLEVKADKLKAKADMTKAKIAKNRHMREMFEKGISDIDSTLISKGKVYLSA